MDDSFELPVRYRGEELSFTAELLAYGYSHKIKVQVYDHEVMFEPDEERNYRALIDPELLSTRNVQLSRELLQAIAVSIESIVK